MTKIVLTVLIVFIWGLLEFKEATPESAPIMSFECISLKFCFRSQPLLNIWDLNLIFYFLSFSSWYDEINLPSWRAHSHRALRFALGLMFFAYMRIHLLDLKDKISKSLYRLSCNINIFRTFSSKQFCIIMYFFQIKPKNIQLIKKCVNLNV